VIHWVFFDVRPSVNESVFFVDNGVFVAVVTATMQVTTDFNTGCIEFMTYNKECGSSHFLPLKKELRRHIRCCLTTLGLYSCQRLLVSNGIYERLWTMCKK
jgi:hypothetical protein